MYTHAIVKKGSTVIVDDSFYQGKWVEKSQAQSSESKSNQE
jgi:hypothetical protein